MNDSAFRELLAFPAGWHEVALRAPGDEPNLAACVAAGAAALPGAEVLDWKKLNPTAASLIQLQTVGVFIMMGIAYLAVAMMVFNTMLMNVFERIREFGVMKAIGTGPSQILALVAAEALVEGLLAAALALALALPFSLWLGRRGLDLSGMAGDTKFSGMVMEPVMYPQVDAGTVAPPLLFLLAITLLAVAYPALKAARLKPVEAIHHS
jgi:ABC-type antimicrobial peptide transport system permease subunit